MCFFAAPLVGAAVGGAGMGFTATLAASGGIATLGTQIAAGLSTAWGAMQAAQPYLSLASSAISGYSKYQGQRAQQRSQAAYYAYQGQVARNNQYLAERQAGLVIAAGRRQEAAHRRKVAQVKGAQIAGLSASNVVFSEDTSALDVLGDTAMLGELDALTIRSNAKEEAYRHRINALQFGEKAQFMQTAAADQYDFLGPAGSLLETVGTVSDKWYRYNRSGAIG